MTPVMQTIGNYEVLERIAEGGMGAIYKARHLQTGQIVALKVMATQVASSSVLVKRFEQEFRAASRLNHPNIVRALDYGESAGTPYLVMEFVEGESLGQKLEREGSMPENDAIRIIAQVAQGLHRAHKEKLVHRDVKPDNILITPDGQAKLVDLGLVKEMDADLNLTRTGRGLGTPHFMAPEQFRKAKDADARCDIYSLGATLYMMVTGELPFRSTGPLDAWMKKMNNELKAPRELVPTLSERIDWAIRRAMSGDPDQRPASCREFVEDLTGRSTRRVSTSDVAAAVQDVWYLVYKDELGESHTVKGSTPAIRHSLRQGLLGDADNVRASRDKTGPFEKLRSYPEFRDLVVTAAPMQVQSGRSSNPTAPVSAPHMPTRTSPRDGSTPPASPSRAEPAPHIPFGAPADVSPSSVEGLKWLLMLALLAGCGAVAYFLWLKEPLQKLLQ